MKTTKAVEVFVCDVCGHQTEWKPNSCIKCKRDLCGGCRVRLEVVIQRVGMYEKVGQFESFSVGHDPVLGYGAVEYRLGYCVDCGKAIEEELLKCGFVAKPSDRQPYQAVMD